MAADFECGWPPAAPTKQTTKKEVESFIADLLGWGRSCSTKLGARGADAQRYGLVK